MNGWDGWTRREPPVERLAFTQVKTLARRPQRDLELLGPRPVIRMRSGWKSWLMLGHPDAVRHVFQDNARNYVREAGSGCVFAQIFGAGLLTGDDRVWDFHRSVVTPALRDTDAARAKLAAAAAWSAQRMVGELTSARPGEVELFGALRKTTLNVATTLLFDEELGTGMDALAAAFDRVVGYLGWRGRFPLPSIRLGLGRELRLLRKTAEGLRARARDGEPRDRMRRMTEPETGAPLADDTGRDLFVSLLFTGHESLTCALSWCFVLLADRPRLQARLRKEADEALEGRTVAEAVEHLELAGRVFDEVLRLYPPVPRQTRQAVREDAIMGYRVPAGSKLQLSIYALHHHPDYWEDPERFDPDRFAPTLAKQREPFAYLPFGAGAHRCPAEELARLEARIILAEVMRRCSVWRAPGALVEPAGGISLRPTVPLRMELRRWSA